MKTDAVEPALIASTLSTIKAIFFVQTTSLVFEVHRSIYLVSKGNPG